MTLFPRESCKYSESNKTYTFPNGSVIEFGYCDSEGDVQQYQSAEYDIIRFDELTHFCVHPETDVLTNTGWKSITDVTPRDSVYSLRPDGQAQFVPVSKNYEFLYTGDLLECDQPKGLSFSVTPNHKLPIRKQKGKDWYFVEADNLPRFANVMRAAPRAGASHVVAFEGFPEHQHKGHNEAHSIDMDLWLEYLGWWFAEGCAFENREGMSPKVTIRQMKACPELVSLMERMPFRHTISKDGQYSIFSRQLFEYFKQFGDKYTKRIPAWLFDMGPEQIQIFLTAFEKGDGHTTKSGAIGIGLCNEGLIDDLQTLYCLTGRIATKSKSITKEGFTVHRLSVSVARRVSTEVRADSVHRRHHDGAVWCLSVPPYNNFMTRRNGRVSFTGNTEFQYTYMISRIRGANDFPKQLKCSTNPGSVGHSWVKKRFIEKQVPQTIFTDETGRTFTFIPAKVQENRFLMQADPGYVNRLRQLGEAEQKALLDGDWDIFKGQYFPEFDREIHVCRPFELPLHWTRFRSLDYGLDMCSCGWWAVDTEGRLYRYRELHEPGLTLSQAAAKIVAMTPPEEEIRYTVASPDLWNRRQETGVPGQETMYYAGLKDLRKADAHRINGWRTLREYLASYEREGVLTADLVIFDTCVNAITCLPALIHDTLKVEDASSEPHDVTHSPEEVRYAVMSRPQKTKHDKPELTRVQSHKAKLIGQSKPQRRYR